MTSTAGRRASHAALRGGAHQRVVARYSAVQPDLGHFSVKRADQPSRSRPAVRISALARKETFPGHPTKQFARTRLFQLVPHVVVSFYSRRSNSVGLDGDGIAAATGKRFPFGRKHAGVQLAMRKPQEVKMNWHSLLPACSTRLSPWPRSEAAGPVSEAGT